MIYGIQEAGRIVSRIAAVIQLERATMLDVTKQPDSISFDIPLLMSELSFITGPHAASMLRRLADALDLDLMNFFPETYEETHVSRFIDFLRRIEKAKIVYISTTED
jgi:hypothetical protein